MKKKSLFVLCCIFISATILSCSKNKAVEGSFQTSRTRLLDILLNSETEDNKEIAEKVIEGIKEKDIDKIKALFSKQSLSEISDIDNQIKKLIDFVNEANINEYEIDNGFEGMSRGGGVTEELSRSCFIWYPNYKDHKFRIIIYYYKINLKEPELEGVVSIGVYQQEKYSEPVEIIKIGNFKL